MFVNVFFQVTALVLSVAHVISQIHWGFLLSDDFKFTPLSPVESSLSLIASFSQRPGLAVWMHYYFRSVLRYLLELLKRFLLSYELCFFWG